MSPLFLLRLLGLSLIVLALAASAAAQDIRIPESAINNRMRTDLRVDPISHALQFQIPLGQYPGRGGSSLPITLYYSSKLWNIQYMNTIQCQNNPGSLYRAEYAKFSSAGWTSSLGTASKVTDVSLQLYDAYTTRPSKSGSTLLNQIARIFIAMPDGSRHELRKDDSFHSSSENITGLFYSVDGSRLIYDATTNTLYLPDGSRYIMGPSVQTYIDRNGNQLSYSSSTGQWTDTLGRSIGQPLSGAVGDGVGLSELEYNYSIPGVGGVPLTYTFRWKHLSTAGVINELETYQTLRYKGDRITNCQSGTDYSGLFHSAEADFNGIQKSNVFDPVVLYQIVLPHDASNQNPPTYTFKYNIYGEITKVIYPTGGYERFGYGQAPLLSAEDGVGLYSQANRGVTTAWVSPDGTQASEPLTPWTYVGFNTNAPDGTHTDRSVFTNIYDWSAYAFEDPRLGMVYDERTYSAGGQMMRRKLTDYAVDGQAVQYSGNWAYKQRNPRPAKEVEIVLDTGGNALTTTTTYQYDADLNRKATNHYDFWSVDQTTAQTGAITLMQQGTLLGTEEATFLVNDPAVSPTTQAAYRARNLVALPTSSRVKNGVGTIVAQSSISYDEATYPLLTNGAVTGWSDPGTTVRGNATTARGWLDTTGAYLQTHAQYDQCGSVRYSWDAKGYQSQIEYSNNYAYAYPTLTRTAVPDPSGVYGATTALVSTSVYDFSTGQPTSTTDPNNQTTSFGYTDPQTYAVDPFNRVRTITRPDAGMTTYNYGDSPGLLYVETLTKQNSTQNVDVYQFFDGLGRPNRSFLSVGSGSYVTTDTQYDVMGRIWSVSNPYFSAGSASAINPSGLWTTNVYDALGRVRTRTTPDTATVTTDYGGSTSGVMGTTVTVTDQAGKLRRSLTDALGRLVRMDEPDSNGNLGVVTSPNQPTSYSYDVLGNLRRVTQGSQQRFFAYDSLSRLLRARNPEQAVNASLPAFTDPITGNTQWSMAYTYDNNLNLTTRIDARNVTTTYAYDALNRNYSRSYSDSTPAVAYIYDASSVTNSKGRMTSVSSSVSSYGYSSYDALGRVLGGTQTTDGQAYTMGYAYDLAGNMTSQTYPSGRVIASEYDAAGRLAGVKNLASGAFYAGGASTDSMNRVQYTPHGAASQMRLGNGLWEHTNFNLRLQPIQIGLGSAGTNSSLLQLDYSYGTTDNNGNVQSQTITVPTVAGVNGFTATQNYTYEALNRLASAQENGGASWKQNFLYDRFGNRKLVAGTTFPAQLNASNNPVINANNNRIDPVASGQTSYSYDGAGNLTHDAAVHAFGYDAENKQRTYDGGATTNGGATYYYDGAGQRVKKVIGGATIVTTVFVYNIAGQLIAEYGGTSGSGGTSYLTSDTLGTPRVITGPNQAIKARHDYLPFGEELFSGSGGRTSAQGYVGDNLRQKFTSKERDNETGLDYFISRYYSSAQGRFTTADSWAGRGVNPQSFNRYSYVINNPLKYVDLWGRQGELPKKQGKKGQGEEDIPPDGENDTDDGECPCPIYVIPAPGPKYIPNSRQIYDDWFDVLRGRFSFGSYMRNAGGFLDQSARNGEAQGQQITNNVNEALGSPDLMFALSMTPAGSLIGAEDEAYVTVGRWMSQLELDKMMESALVQESRLGGITSVTFPANPNAYLNSKAGTVYVQFDVLKSVLRGANGSTAKIYGPNSMFGPLLNIQRMPQAKNIVPIMSKIPRK